MALKPLHTTVELIHEARKAGHFILYQGSDIAIDTGEEMLTVSGKAVTNRAGTEISLADALAIVKLADEV